MKVLALDQSNSPGICLIDDMASGTGPVILETFDCGKLVGFDRTAAIIDRVLGLLREHQPEIFVHESLDFGSPTNNMAQMAEMVGSIKYVAKASLGYTMGYGTSHNEAERQACRDAMLYAGPLRVVVAQSSGGMKKFCLGKGNLKKDTKYLMTIQKSLGLEFKDDNQADAYMHSQMATVVVGVLRGVISMSNLPQHQQEAIFTANGSAGHFPKGMGMKTALSLTDDKKLRLVNV